MFLAAAACVTATPVSFEKEIKPILERRRVKCHGAAARLGKLDLRNRPWRAGSLAKENIAEQRSHYRHRQSPNQQLVKQPPALLITCHSRNTKRSDR